MIDKRKNVVFDDTPIKCDKCGGRYIFQGAGKYICEDCGNVVYDDFGKVKAYIDEHGPSPGIVISEATGVFHAVHCFSHNINCILFFLCEKKIFSSCS